MQKTYQSVNLLDSSSEPLDPKTRGRNLYEPREPPDLPSISFVPR